MFRKGYPLGEYTHGSWTDQAERVDGWLDRALKFAPRWLRGPGLEIARNLKHRANTINLVHCGRDECQRRRAGPDNRADLAPDCFSAIFAYDPKLDSGSRAHVMVDVDSEKWRGLNNAVSPSFDEPIESNRGGRGVRRHTRTRQRGRRQFAKRDLGKCSKGRGGTRWAQPSVLCVPDLGW